MAAVNSVQGGLRLPLAGLAPPRVLMCSASMGAEGSVTLQLREAVQAPDSGSTLDGALTIGYPDPEMLADMLGSIQAAGTGEVTSFDILDSRDQADIGNSIISKSTTAIQTSIESLSHHSHKINSNSSSNNQSNNNNNSNTNNNNLVNNNTNNNDHSTSNNNNSNNSSSNNNNNEHLVPVSSLPITKKARPKTASPTRHGPQQCQVCSKVFGNASALAKHKLTHSDERKYVCGMCSKAFKRQDHLNGHMLTHRNKKPYECKAEGCGKSYCDARSLRRHTENHHSSLAMTPTTPNQSLTSSTGPPTGLSLSPATASGDASSPHGATCIQFNGNDGSKPSSPSSPAGAGNEGLTRQQLDLISQIMQQTKQANAGINGMATSSGSNGNGNGNSNSVGATTGTSQRQTQRPRTWNMQTQLQQTQSKLTTNADNLTSTTQPSTPKFEQKPVECNLCHRKFKNVPALNGHMRLHGGYFKKDAETKKCDKKETPGPPLQTASVGIRALIEEKIISKRSKDLKGSFVIPAPPLAARRMSETDSFITHKSSTTTAQSIQATIVTSSSQSNIGTAITNISQVNTTAIATSIQQPSNQQKLAVATTCSPATLDTKDATLIELLKRGTKVAVKRTCSDPGQLTFNTSNSNQTTTALLLPSPSSLPSTPTSAQSLTLGCNTTTTPLSLTISQTPSDSGDVFTLAYSADTTTTSYFSENDVYNVPDTAMLLQAVDSIQLLQDSTASNQLDEIGSLSDYTISENGDINESTILTRYTPSRQLQAVLNSPLPESLAEFSTLHSKDFVLYGCASSESPATQSSGSPLPSPLAYPTPPASHETVAQASPFLDDSHHFSDANFFDDKKNIDFLDKSDQFFKDSQDSDLTDNEKILKLKNELFNDSKSVIEEHIYFKAEPEDVYETKASDIIAEATSHTDKAIADFNQNLSFLDEPQNFLDDARNTSSPLSAAFFTGTMSSAEEVKEALEEVLPNENITSESASDNDIDLYYLPALTLQSHMMLNSDDPLLSSSPKDFAHKQQQMHKFDFNVFCPPNTKKAKIEIIEENKKPLTVQTEQIPNEVFLSPSSISSASPPPVPKTNHCSSSSAAILKKRQHHGMRRNIIHRSMLRKFTTSHYTPAPMLNPDRNAPGLYSTLTRDLLEDVIDFDFTDSSCVPEFISKSRMNIGSDFQASIQPCSANSTEYSSNIYDDQLLWDPSIARHDKHVQRFVDLAKSSAVPLGSHSEETALKTLLEAQGETHIAILSLLQVAPTPIHKRWSQTEIETFLKGLEEFGKDFYRIAQEIPNKTTADCVQFYYFWKKLRVDYKIPHQTSENGDGSNHQHAHHVEMRPHVCEMPDCSASFTSKAALHGHTRIHCIGRSINLQHQNSGGALHSGSSHGLTSKDDYPCKVCGKVFNKVKSRSAHMKSHRPQDSDPSTT